MDYNSISIKPYIIQEKVVVSYKRKYEHELLVICLFKPAQEKSVVRWTDRPAMTIAVDLGRKATKQPTIKPYIKSHLELQREITLIELAPSPFFFV